VYLEPRVRLSQNKERPSTRDRYWKSSTKKFIRPEIREVERGKEEEKSVQASPGVEAVTGNNKGA
jgi:hypothetical protein